MNRNRITSALVLLVAIAGIFYFTIRTSPDRQEPLMVASSGNSAATEILLAEPSPTQVPDPSSSGVVGKNDFFFNILKDRGISPQQIDAIIRASKPVYNFGRIKPGQHYEIFTGSDGNLERLTFSLDGLESYIEVIASDGSYVTAKKEYAFATSISKASGIITTSFFGSLIDQGLSNELGAKIANIYAWDIDFFSQIRKNDYFKVIYEEKTMLEGPGSKNGTRIGRILAAELNTSGISNYAFLYENEKDFIDYFDEEGKSLRKQLLRAPLNYTRISSSYSRRRFHPVLHKYKPHLGIDYAAPIGTPIMSTGDGTVITASRTRANGNYIKIRHNSNYISYYLHLSKFGKGIKKGVRVKQGATIGYVGSTGYSTGPHLDYRVKKNGRFVNPRKLKLPPAKPVSTENMDSYLLFAGKEIEKLDRISIKDPRGEYYVDKTDNKTAADNNRRPETGSSASN